MQNYEVSNSAELEDFFKTARDEGHGLSAVKGQAPIGAQYSDGELIKQPVNVAWVNDSTNARIDIVYKAKGGA